MKKLIILAFLLVSGIVVNAQGILNNGAYIVMNGAAQIYVDGAAAGGYKSQANGLITPSATGIISIEGDWTNNAGNTGFTADAGTVRTTGFNSFIRGTSSTTFYNFTCLNSGFGTVLTVNTSIGGVVTTTGVLSLGNVLFDLGGNTLTITNPSTAAITYGPGPLGFIQSETAGVPNNSILKWKTNAAASTYVFPFGISTPNRIPLTFNKTTAVASDISIATRKTFTSANTPWAFGVTHMYDPNLASDGSDEAVIDRWWEITASTAVSADITFSYQGVENTLIAPYNTGNLGAQYWTTGWMPNNSNIGSAPAVLVGVGSVLASGLAISTAYTPWILSSLAAPLPVELVSFTSQCNESNVSLSWTTATETNNNFFTVERSDDGIAFRSIGTVQGAGNSSQNLSYSFIDTEPTTGTTYYRLRQTDYNGQFTTTSPIVQEQCGNAGETISAFGDGSDLVVSIYTPQESNYVVNVFDAQGKLVVSQKIAAGIGSNRTVLGGIIPSVGVYMINVTGDSGIQYGSKVYFAK